MQPPLGKNFSYYALITFPGEADCNVGIYTTWTELVRIRTRKEREGNEYFLFKGFYSFEEAVTWVYHQIPSTTNVEYLELEPREGTMIEFQWQQIK